MISTYLYDFGWFVLVVTPIIILFIKILSKHRKRSANDIHKMIKELESKIINA